MNEAALKALKWTILMLFVIMGSYGLYATEAVQDPRWLAMSVIGFGAVYLFDAVWKNMKNKIMITSVLVMIGTAFLSFQNIGPTWFFMLTDSFILFDFTFFQIWGALTVSIGYTVMFFMYLRYD